MNDKMMDTGTEQKDEHRDYQVVQVIGTIDCIHEDEENDDEQHGEGERASGCAAT